MRSPARSIVVAGAAWPLAAAAQAAGGAQTGQSAWNWVIGIAALLVVLALARLIFGPGRPGGGTRPRQGREPHRYA